MLVKKRGQVWIETVIYTLIAFVIIGLVLSFVRPKIEELQDKAVIDQSMAMLGDINTIIISLLQGAGNQRVIEFGIKKGNLKIDGVKNNIVFELESKYTYSEPGIDIQQGSIIARTEKRGTFNEITLLSNYSKYNIQYKGKDEVKTLSKGPTPYKVFISNKGEDESGKIILNFEVN